MDWDDLNESHYDWPSLADTKIFRNNVRTMVLQCIEQEASNRIGSWLDNMWVILMGIEH